MGNQADMGVVSQVRQDCVTKDTAMEGFEGGLARIKVVSRFIVRA